MKNDIVPQKPNRPSEAPRPQDIVRPKPRPDIVRSQPTPLSLPAPLENRIELPDPEKLLPAETAVGGKSSGSRIKRLVIGSMAAILLLVIGCVAAYVFLLSPKNASATETVQVEIVSGMPPGQIADILEQQGVIRSGFVFRVYARLNGIQSGLQAGNYQLSPASSTPDIARQIYQGPSASEIEVLFRPGETLADNKKTLLSLGYSTDEIDAAFAASYGHPLFEGRPAGSDLEGYIFGETHRFVKGTPVEDILRRYFDDYYAVIEEHDLVNKYKEQGLSLYEGITLASIIQREVRSDADQKQVAQIFLYRLGIGMSLGADATYEYAAKKAGVTPSLSFDSPYNTRIYTGLPPGPIASPGVSSLVAVAHPAEGDYLYFVSGDDGVNHFSHTNEEHEQKVRQYCTTLCFGQ